MKPDWKDAPEWANWLAQDSDGYWVWYEAQPTWVDEVGEWDTRTGRVLGHSRQPLPQGSRERRP